MTPEDIIQFWYTPPMSEHWFNSTPEIDEEIRNRFEKDWESVASGRRVDLLQTPEGCLALCIMLDQFPLNMFRGKTKSYATEDQAIQISKYAIKKGFDRRLPKEQLLFLYMPLMHSESLPDQTHCVSLLVKAGLRENLPFANHHKNIIERFGRFPHRNELLGRPSTDEEIEYLNSDEAFKG